MKLRTVCLTLVAAFVLTAFTRGDDKTAAKEDAQAKEMSLSRLRCGRIITPYRHLC